MISSSPSLSLSLRQILNSTNDWRRFRSIRTFLMRSETYPQFLSKWQVLRKKPLHPSHSKSTNSTLLDSQYELRRIWMEWVGYGLAKQGPNLPSSNCVELYSLSDTPCYRYKIFEKTWIQISDIITHTRSWNITVLSDCFYSVKWFPNFPSQTSDTPVVSTTGSPVGAFCSSLNLLPTASLCSHFAPSHIPWLCNFPCSSRE